MSTQCFPGLVRGAEKRNSRFTTPIVVHDTEALTALQSRFDWRLFSTFERARYDPGDSKKANGEALPAPSGNLQPDIKPLTFREPSVSAAHRERNYFYTKGERLSVEWVEEKHK